MPASLLHSLPGLFLWASLLFVFYTYLGYPLILYLLARL